VSTESPPRQQAIGSYIAQAIGEGAQARVEIIQQAAFRPTAATAPAAPMHFIGRRDDLDALKDALTKGQSTMLTALLGMGGIGKTATAQKLAAELQDQFTGGIFWGSLPEHHGDAHSILHIWARVCGQDTSTELDVNVIAQLVRGLLTDRRTHQGPLMVIIDDVRHNWLAAIQVLQRSLPDQTPLLLTTRDETLAAALGTKVHRLDTLPPNDALTLLKVHAGQAMIEENVSVTSALLQAIGYLPLAIELAGKRLALMSRKPGYRLEFLLREVTERTAALSLPGHPGLATTFAITYDDLPADTRRLFRWLGVFTTAPFYVSSVAGVLSLSESETEATLDKLVQVALIAWGNEEGMYTMHPLLRQYARTLLIEAEEFSEAEKSHLAYHLELARANSQVDPVVRYGVRFRMPAESQISPEEARFIYGTLTGFSDELLESINALERVGKIELARACYVVHQGLWTKDQVEMIVLGSQHPSSVLGGLAQQHQRHLYIHDLLHARASLLGDMLDCQLAAAARIANLGSLSNQGDGADVLEINFDGELYAKRYLCKTPLVIPWLYKDTSPMEVTARVPFHVLVRARDIADMHLHLESDMQLAQQLHKQTEQPTFIIVPYDFMKLSPEVNETVYSQAQSAGIGIIVCPESILNLDSDANQRLMRSRILRR
jgi:hypothetical protein